jgi:hypothetical protein
MKKKGRLFAWIAWGLALLSLPLCCLAALAVVPSPLFLGELRIVNGSAEALRVTPIGEAYGQKHPLARSYSRFPYLSVLRQGDIRLAPGQSVRVWCEVDEDLTFSEIAVRNAAGEYRQWAIRVPSSALMPASNAAGEQGRTFVIESFADLTPILPAALQVAKRARFPAWTSWGAILAGIIPVALLALGLWLARGARSTPDGASPDASRSPSGEAE